ncbi:hypothetical protein [Algoriphagus boritolerans]|nr:hypothetical protein [Algoriphagus boritolerans]
MKMEAAMLGANVILIGNSSSRGNTYGNENVPSVSTQTVLFGQAYNSFPLNIEKLKEELKNKKVHYYLTYRLNKRMDYPEMTVSTKYDSDRNHLMTEITEVFENNGKLFVKINDFKSKTNALQVIRANENQIVLMKQLNNKIYNYILLTEKSDVLKNPSTIRRVIN